LGAPCRMSPFDCTAVLQMAGIGTELTGELGLVCSAPSQRTFRATFQNGELSAIAVLVTAAGERPLTEAQRPLVAGEAVDRVWAGFRIPAR